MTETTSDVAAGEAEESEVITVEGEVTEAGRYIPYSGGTMGWFENSGVLKCEKPNNYLFYTAMESDLIRSKQFERWGENFNRRGDRSVYGDVVVTFKPDAGEDTEVGVVRGVAVFTPNFTRILQISLRPPNGVALRGGRLHVAYRERADEGSAVLAEAEIPVP